MIHKLDKKCLAQIQDSGWFECRIVVDWARSVRKYLFYQDKKEEGRRFAHLGSSPPVSIRVETVLCLSEDACKGVSSPLISSVIKLVLQENLSSLIRNPSFFACVSLLRKTIGSVYPEGLVRTSKWRV